MNFIYKMVRRFVLTHFYFEWMSWASIDETDGAYRLVGSDPFGNERSLDGDAVVCGLSLSSWHEQRKWTGDFSVCFFGREISFQMEKRRILKDVSGEWINGY